MQTPSASGPPWDDLANQAVMAGMERYYRWLVDLVRPWAGRRILDAGCGIGNLARHWLDRERVVGVEVEPVCAQRARDRLGAHANFQVVELDLADPRLRDLARHRFDTVTCFNVLEHVREDEAALANLHAVLQPGGHLLLLVPAGPRLYGALDEAERHHRRYGKEELRRKARRAGFRVLRLRHSNLPAVFGWYVVGRILRRRRLPAGTATAYDHISPLVSLLERTFPPPAGLSLILVAQKS